MLDQLPLFARGLGRVATCSKVLPEVLDLTEDEDITVCCTALAALSSIAHLLTPGVHHPAPLAAAKSVPCLDVITPGFPNLVLSLLVRPLNSSVLIRGSCAPFPAGALPY